jgi:hypothetical protein
MNTFLALRNIGSLNTLIMNTTVPKYAHTFSVNFNTHQRKNALEDLLLRKTSVISSL